MAQCRSCGAKIHPLVHGEQLQEGFFVTPEELEQVQREAFAAGRALISKRPYPNRLEYLFETPEDYWQQKTESKEAND